jgi:hypothetical protein
LHRRDHGVGQVHVDAAAGQQKPGERSDGAGDICRRGARVAMGALDEERVNIGQAHLAPGLARGRQVIEQLADVVELLVDGGSLGCPGAEARCVA